jgi:hypothetical protein
MELHILLANPESFGEVLHNARKQGDAGPGANPRARFHYIFQREVEERDQDLEKKYDEDLNTTLIFVSIALLRQDWV